MVKKPANKKSIGKKEIEQKVFGNKKNNANKPPQMRRLKGSVGTDYSVESKAVRYSFTLP